MSDDKYSSQRKYLDRQKRLQVWVNAEKYEQFRAAVEKNGTSMYAVVNQFIADYIDQNKG